jgi:hypothetical protein
MTSANPRRKRAKLRRDSEIKTAFAAVLNRHWSEPEEQDATKEGIALREMCVACKNEDVAALSHLLPPHPPAAISRQDCIFRDVITFCPMPFPNWQTRAKIVLEKHRKHWHAQLDGLRQVIGQRLSSSRPPSWNGSMYPLPFGQYLNSTSWISDLLEVEVDIDDFISNRMELRLPPSKSKIYYFTRPYILWPVRPGTVEHVSIWRNLSISRHPLDDDLLRQRGQEQSGAQP